LLSYVISSGQLEFIKIYIGQLPLEFEEDQLTKILEPLAQLKEVKYVNHHSESSRAITPEENTTSSAMLSSP
jgi:hypothetical protein